MIAPAAPMAAPRVSPRTGVLFLLEGQITAFVDGTYDVEPGGLVAFLAGTPSTFEVVGESARFVAITCGDGAGRFIADFARSAPVGLAGGGGSSSHLRRRRRTLPCARSSYIVAELGEKWLDKPTVRDVRAWLNRLRIRCQCSAQGKDTARQVPECCAADQRCRRLLPEWMTHQAGRGAADDSAEDLVGGRCPPLSRVVAGRRRPVLRRLRSAADQRNFHREFTESAIGGGGAGGHALDAADVRPLLVKLEVHPRVAMQILRHSKISLTMDIYAQVHLTSAWEALSRLRGRLDLGAQ